MKNKKMVYIAGAVIVILTIWILYSFVSTRNIEEPRYKVVSTTNEYEIREYESYIIAETTIKNARDSNDAANKGFPIIANYIFGNNTKADKIAMTTPVNTEQGVSEKIAMTAPVNTQQENSDGVYRISFIMPSKYTLETLPQPNDKRVVINEIPVHTMAVKSYSWSNSEKKVEKLKKEFIEKLSNESITIVGTPLVSRYNPPFTIPFMLRNEIQIKVTLP